MSHFELLNKGHLAPENRLNFWSELISGSGLDEKTVSDIAELVNSAIKKEDTHSREVTPEVDFLNMFASYLRTWFKKTLEWDDAEKRHLRTGEVNTIVLNETEMMIINLYRELRKDAIDSGL